MSRSTTGCGNRSSATQITRNNTATTLKLLNGCRRSKKTLTSFTSSWPNQDQTLRQILWSYGSMVVLDARLCWACTLRMAHSTSSSIKKTLRILSSWSTTSSPGTTTPMSCTLTSPWAPASALSIVSGSCAGVKTPSEMISTTSCTISWSSTQSSKGGTCTSLEKALQDTTSQIFLASYN